MEIPAPVIKILLQLEAAGHCAVAVGGCVRDLTLGKEPHDWDVATDATPPEMCNLFSEYKLLQTGVRFGTITVLTSGLAVEVTTFRTDGPTRDARHPDTVVFGKSLEEDCARRDFTINALCLDARCHLYDFHNGIGDLKKKTLRCIGKPELRFSEDALRILRALRLACQLDFFVEINTADAIRRQKEILAFLSPERILGELLAMLQAPLCAEVMLEFWDVMHAVLPVWVFAQSPDAKRKAILRTADCLPPDAGLRLSLFLMHQSENEKEADTLLDNADRLFKKLRASNALRHRVLSILNVLGTLPYVNEKRLMQTLSTVGETALRDALLIDSLLAAENRDKCLQAALSKTENCLNLLTVRPLCLSPTDLAIGGDDLLELGILPGPFVGRLLREMVHEVQSGKLENNRNTLLLWAERCINR